ncbi:MAG: DegT/DnrJ/EryC1/StrS family aminotransferase [candidate division Zixibacteria bacterium]|nr:DegT/DnrJ/EryC1/StrS family aminotransferase [candidate division Zixibacteria bacterium]
MFRLVPPAGTALSITDTLHIKLAWLRRIDKNRGFFQNLQNQFQSSHLYPVNSGRAALSMILDSIKQVVSENKNEIIVPAYTCYSVAASIVKSGYKIRLVDVCPETLDFDFSSLEKQDFSNVAAILVCSLFGIVNDWGRLRKLSQDNDILLIDDAAQALGESYEGTPCGTLGDAGFYSFGRGKNLSVYSGGMIVTKNSELAPHLTQKYDSLPSPGFIANVSSLFKMDVYSLMSRPVLFWFPAMLPFLGIGETVYDESFYLAQSSRVQKCGMSVLFPKLKKLREKRIQNSIAIVNSLEKSEKIVVPGFESDNCPGYIRLPVLVKDKETRDNIIERLRDIGIVASTMYPGTISKIEAIKDHLAGADNDYPGAQSIVDRLLTLPTHPYVSKRDIESMVVCITS